MCVRRIIAVIIFCISLIIESVSAQFKVGAEVGYLNNHYNFYSGTVTKQQHGYQVGVIASYTIRDFGWLESGLTLQKRGFEFEPLYGSLPNPVYSVKMNAMYLDLPILMGLKFNLGNNMSIIPKMGAFFSYGLSGTARFDGRIDQGEPFSVEYDVFTALYHTGPLEDPRMVRYKLDPFDAGLQLGLDFMWKQYAVRGAYKFGLTDHNFFESRIDSRAFSISLAYYFYNK